MKRRIQGLNEVARCSVDEVPDGVFLVRVDKAQYRWHRQKPFYLLKLSVLEPREFAGHTISGRLYCTSKALWLGWFLRDFVYDPELLGREEIDEQALFGLRGIVKISHTIINGTSLLNSTASLRPANGKSCPPCGLKGRTARKWRDDL